MVILRNLCTSVLLPVSNCLPATASSCKKLSKASSKHRGVPGWECFVHVYVDDMIIISHNINSFKKIILAQFCMEDLGEAKHILGIKLTKLTSSTLLLSQLMYTQSILNHYNIRNCQSQSTPILANSRLVRFLD